MSGFGRRDVTAVVYVNRDWPAAEETLQSLAAPHGHQAQLIVVDDSGSEWRNPSAAASASAYGAVYAANQQHLGYGASLERVLGAVASPENDVLVVSAGVSLTPGCLAEMIDVLNLIDRHGVVCPRSNLAGHATFPVQRLSSTPDTFTHCEAVHALVREQLPRASVVPTVPSGCVLLRRVAVDNFGIFDHRAGDGDSTIHALCERLSRFGFSTVLSNRALVRRASPVRPPEGASREVVSYLRSEIDPYDRFADAIADQSGPLELLLDLYHLPMAFSGSTRIALSLLQQLARHHQDLGLTVTVLARREAAQFHRLGRFGLQVIEPESLTTEIFHVGYCPTQVFDAENLVILNRHCLRFAFALLDVIALRCRYHSADRPELRSVLRDSLDMADLVVTVSDFTRKDALLWFSDSVGGLRDKLVTIHHGVPAVELQPPRWLEEPRTHGQRQPGYVLVIGNDFDHKAVHHSVVALSGSHHRVAVFGPTRLDLPPTVDFIPGGVLSDAELAGIIDGCSVVVFPSQYEGFGFPILEAAAHHKPLLHFDSESAAEVVALVSGHIPTRAFTRFGEIPGLVNDLLVEPTRAPSHLIRQQSEYDGAVVELLCELGRSGAPDAARLRQRWGNGIAIERYMALLAPVRTSAKDRLARRLRALPRLYRWARRVARLTSA